MELNIEELNKVISNSYIEFSQEDILTHKDINENPRKITNKRKLLKKKHIAFLIIFIVLLAMTLIILFYYDLEK